MSREEAQFTPALWIETDDNVSPHLADLAAQNVEVVRVFSQARPFVFGELIALFVGENARKNAMRFVGCNPNDPESHDWRRKGENHTTDGRTIYYECKRCGAQNSS